MEDNLTWKEKFFWEKYKIDLRKKRRKPFKNKGEKNEKPIT